MKALLGVVVVGLSATAHADTQVWLEGGLGIRASNRVEVELAPELRYDQTAEGMDKFLADASVRYRWKRWLRTGAGYRFEYVRNNNGELVVRHRLALDVRLRFDLEPFRLDYRAMLFEQLRPSSNDQERTGIRNRVVVSYRKWRPWVPSAGVEVFHALGDLDQFQYAKVRFWVAGSWGRGDHDVELGLRFEVPADSADPTYVILALGYHFQV